MDMGRNKLYNSRRPDLGKHHQLQKGMIDERQAFSSVVLQYKCLIYNLTGGMVTRRCGPLPLVSYNFRLLSARANAASPVLFSSQFVDFVILLQAC